MPSDKKLKFVQRSLKVAVYSHFSLVVSLQVYSLIADCILHFIPQNSRWSHTPTMNGPR